jgi:hypothetical protein
VPLEGSKLTTAAILEPNPVVGRALEALLGDTSYDMRILETPLENESLAEVLDGVDVLLLGSGLDAERREDFLRAMRSTPQTVTIPVLSLSPAPTPKGALAKEVRQLPWPLTTEDLVREIEAALAPGASSPHRDRGY